MRQYKILGIIFLLSTVTLLGHVNITYPVGGETFNAGDTITIKWVVAIDHGSNKWDLYFSSDGGSSVVNIASDLPKSQLSYAWVVPQTSTNQGIITVVQNNDVGADYQDMSGDFTINVTTTGITDKNDLAKNFVIYPAYPNPFNNSTVISFNLPEQSPVKINIYNIAGEKVKTLINSEMQQGLHKISWNADDFPSGVYFYAIETRNFIETRKLILLK